MLTGEQKATNALKEAANVLADSPSALQLRYLQVKLSVVRCSFEIQNYFNRCDGKFVTLGFYCMQFILDFEQHWKREKYNDNISRSD